MKKIVRRIIGKLDIISRYINTSLTRIYSSAHIGSKTTIEIGARLRFSEGGEISIGKDCYLHSGCILWPFGGKITIGDNCSVNPYSILYGHGGLRIENNVRIASHVVIIPANHNIENVTLPIYSQGLSRKGILIEDDVWIGSGAKILDGVTIKRGCVIASGAVLTKSTIANGVYAGVPAKFLRFRGEESQARR
ncbi:acyltransferase [Pleomorphomonas oryzae]|uniref:acyltransferase n=1 Tax=Pleomorphomonas oryzae TaxID=261934 RepID=UPI001FE158F7|nr:acyltransferase [Pleomorphomonas oryzae]